MNFYQNRSLSLRLNLDMRVCINWEKQARTDS